MNSVLFNFVFVLPSVAWGLSMDAVVTRGRLFEAFNSPSGKLTYSPEIVVPEPKDPTAILLQTNAIQGVSQKIRRAKANAAFIQGSLDTLRTFVNEQESSRGSFPGPVACVYCLPKEFDESFLKDVADCKADGVLLPYFNGAEISGMDEARDEAFAGVYQLTLDLGLQPIPEVVLSEEFSSKLSKDDVCSLMDSICGNLSTDPVAAVLTINVVDNESEEAEVLDLPQIPKYKYPLLNSIRATAGENRLGAEAKRVKDAGFHGAFLRSDCLPGFRMNPDLELVGTFWEACISDLKSTRSKSFSFRAKNNMNKSLSTQWANYQQSVVDSGALGDPDESYSVVDSAAGEYKGFA